jgi:hypothetical protein
VRCGRIASRSKFGSRNFPKFVPVSKEFSDLAPAAIWFDHRGVASHAQSALGPAVRQSADHLFQKAIKSVTLRNSRPIPALLK